jgi:hypothetical protein
MTRSIRNRRQRVLVVSPLSSSERLAASSATERARVFSLCAQSSRYHPARLVQRSRIIALSSPVALFRYSRLPP